MRPADPHIVEARRLLARGNFPEEVCAAYISHCHSAKRRGIAFEFTPIDWWLWWILRCHWSRRGVGAGKMVMARFGDTGPYVWENVHCITHEQNIRDVDQARKGISIRKHWKAKTPEQRAEWHLAVRGDMHPRSRAVLGPYGRFGSTRLAGEAVGRSAAWVQGRALKEQEGWRYETL